MHGTMYNFELLNLSIFPLCHPYWTHFFFQFLSQSDCLFSFFFWFFFFPPIHRFNRRSSKSAATQTEEVEPLHRSVILRIKPTIKLLSLGGFVSHYNMCVWWNEFTDEISIIHVELNCVLCLPMLLGEKGKCGNRIKIINNCFHLLKCVNMLLSNLTALITLCKARSELLVVLCVLVPSDRVIDEPFSNSQQSYDLLPLKIKLLWVT